MYGVFFHPISVDGFKFFMTIMDDFSRFSYIYMLKSKFDVLKFFPEFYILIQTQFGKSIKTVRSDNELAFSDFFKLKGIFPR